MPAYKLIYFNSKGLGELSRYLFAYADVAYEDIRFADREEFVTKWKPTLPTGKAPCLEIDGKKYSESGAIAKYLAREFKLYGKDNIEALRIDGIFDMITQDVMGALFKVYSEQDPTKKEELKKKLVEEGIPAVLKLLEGLADGDFFIGDQITLADLTFFRTVEAVSGYLGNDIPLDAYPKLKKINESVAKEPKIAAWVAKRPVTDH